MKIRFTQLKTSTGTIQVDFGDGYQIYNVSDVIDNGISIPETCTDYSNIKIKSSSKILSDLDVIKNVGIDTSNDYIKIQTIQIKKAYDGCAYNYSVVVPSSEVGAALNQLYVETDRNEYEYVTLEQLDNYSQNYSAYFDIINTAIFYKVARQVSYQDSCSSSTLYNEKYNYIPAPQYRINVVNV